MVFFARLFRQNSCDSFAKTARTPRQKMLQAYMPRRRFSQANKNIQNYRQFFKIFIL